MAKASESLLIPSPIKLKLSSRSTLPTKILFVAQGKNQGKDKKAGTIYSAISEKSSIADLMKDKVFEGKFGETYYHRHGEGVVLAIGMGPAEKFSLEVVRRVMASVNRALNSYKITEASLHFGSNFPKSKNGEELMTAVAEGLFLSAYQFDELKSSKKEAKSMDLEIVTESKAPTKAHAKGLSDGMIIADCINFARRLGDMPGNLMTPEILADEVVKAAKNSKLKVSVWDKARIKKEKMGCLLGVSLGSDFEPRMIIMEYKGSASKKPVCFVGKGLTFDSGGISIKPAAGMEEMKYDMCGGANTVATLLAIARLKLPINALGIVPSSENMPGPSANKPGDITVARNGKSVEINNTDAEGRLILADALVYASEQKPAFIVDSATLTGAMVIALGDLHTGYFSRNKKLTKMIQDCAEDVGESVWHMPLVDEHVDDMKGTYADLSNISTNKGAGSAHGAGFLEVFVDSEIPWAHVDIAGTAYHNGHRIPYNPKRGASGVMVRTYIELAKRWK